MTETTEVSTKEMESIVQDHEKRILALEQNYGEVKQELTSVKTSQLEIKGTLLEEGQKQRELINKQREELEGQRKEQKELMQQLLTHTLGIKKNNNINIWKLALAIVGGGGFLYAVIDLIIKNV
ncbi:hypothetical protein 7F23_20 [uncultured Caudovirales phage]|uniref:Uncharacterized protein n=1 Tax=uncultured Caudovirales phage TaxID=2100421 RepID=A0A2H4J540_9CAUD|nr:hypothetical protein 7F23_20 [uncultured Caudovirales phage]